jgi:spoIIIJ-associated protein
VETEGNTIDDAIERALVELGVGREKAEIEILCDTTRGLFGIGARKARVRASLRRRIDEGWLDATPGKPEAPPLPEQEQAGDDEASMDLVAQGQEAPGCESEHAAVERARDVLAQIIGLMKLDAQVAVAGAGRLAVSGDKRGMLIGRRGQTLDALEYLINRIISREVRAERVTIDAEDYRERRRESLEALAHSLAERVRRRGRPLSLNPMSPRDRRIIHLALQGESSVVTRSTGDGHYRRLIIAPAGACETGRQRGRREGTARPGCEE